MKKKDRRGSAEGSSQDALGPLQDLIRQLRSGARTKTQLVDFNEGRNPFVKKLGGLIFPVWKTIKLGTGLKTADDFRQALKASGFEIGNWANDILGKPAFTAAAKETEVELVRVSVAERGFKNGATRKDIYQRAQELGLELCPNEVGPQLRLQYKDQPYNEWLHHRNGVNRWLGRRPRRVRRGARRRRSVARRRLWHAGLLRCGSGQWVFVRRK